MYILQSGLAQEAGDFRDRILREQIPCRRTEDGRPRSAGFLQHFLQIEQPGLDQVIIHSAEKYDLRMFGLLGKPPAIWTASATVVSERKSYLPGLPTSPPTMK